MDVRDQALAELRALVAIPGALKIITNIPDPDGAALPVTDPAHWVRHDVVAISEPTAKGTVTARSADYDAAAYGYEARITHDECTGFPEAVLTRLREWRG